VCPQMLTENQGAGKKVLKCQTLLELPANSLMTGPSECELACLQTSHAAGGGAGGADFGGGGGAGGLIHVPSYSVTPGVTYTVSVGAGGLPVATNTGGNGQDSTFGSSPMNTLTAIGGAGGLSKALSSGGSGGGQAPCEDPPCPTSTYTSGQGSPGGAGKQGNISPYTIVRGTGGGGGAGGAGGDATPCAAGAGGPGLPFDIETPGTDKFYAGGGGGALITEPYSSSCVHGAAGGSGGGGRGEASDDPMPGVADTGGGGGGSTDFSVFGGPGGSGVVILRY
jgi:hypothetical protein